MVIDELWSVAGLGVSSVAVELKSSGVGVAGRLGAFGCFAEYLRLEIGRFVSIRSSLEDTVLLFLLNQVRVCWVSLALEARSIR